MVLDGSTGEVYVNPDQAVTADYEGEEKAVSGGKEGAGAVYRQAFCHKDGVQVEIVANIGKPGTWIKVLQYDGEGHRTVPHRIFVYGQERHAYRGRAVRGI